jgi:hypothetical protein
MTNGIQPPPSPIILTGQTGEQIRLTKDIFDAFQYFLDKDKQRSGTLEVQFHKGGIAQVETQTKRVYKGGNSP